MGPALLASLHAARAEANFNKNEMEAACVDTWEAIEADETCARAYVCRARCSMMAQEYPDVVKDLTQAFELSPYGHAMNTELRELMRDARILCNRGPQQERRYAARVLGVPQNVTSPSAVKKAYWRLAKAHHPDRHSSSSEAARKYHERRFKRVSQAFDFLTNELGSSSRPAGATNPTKCRTS